MKAASAVAATLALLVFGLGGAACGADRAKEHPTAAAQAKAAARWRAGLKRWHRDTIGALDGMSVQLSSEESLVLLQRRDRRADSRLAGFERTLTNCSATIRKLGAVPAGLELAHQHAMRACKNLGVGARLIQEGVRALRAGRGDELFNLATNPLGDGQNEIEAATASLHLPPS